MVLDRQSLFINKGRNIDDSSLGKSAEDRYALQEQKDHSQDKKINILMKENEELKGYLASLLNLLIKKRVITSEEVTAFVERVETMF